MKGFSCPTLTRGKRAQQTFSAWSELFEAPRFLLLCNTPRTHSIFPFAGCILKILKHRRV